MGTLFSPDQAKLVHAIIKMIRSRTLGSCLTEGGTLHLDPIFQQSLGIAELIQATRHHDQCSP